MLRERILYEDDDFLAFNKAPGELVQGDRQGTASLIDRLSAEIGPGFLQPVHRLDRPASGIVLFAKTKRFFTALSGLFRKREVEKTYWAVVEKQSGPDAAELAHALVPDRRRNIVRVAADSPPNAFLSYRRLGEGDRYAFLVVRPRTGLQHQIRAQLAASGLPIKGDVKYGARRGEADRSILLHARRIAFAHPFTGRAVRFQADPPPGRLWELFAQAAGPD